MYPSAPSGEVAERPNAVVLKIIQSAFLRPQNRFYKLERWQSWPNASVLKTDEGLRPPWVRIPPSPPLTTNKLVCAPDGIASKAQHLRAFLLFAIDFLSIKTPRFSLIFLLYMPPS